MTEPEALTQPLAGAVGAVLARLRDAEQRARRPPGAVTLVAASKTRSVAEVHAAQRAGVAHFGENYTQELAAKAAETPDATWHFIGHLQRNKARVVAQWAQRLHTLDSVRLANALEPELAALGRRLPVLLEVNVAGEGSKSGCAPAEALPLLEHVAARCPHLVVDGLMTLPPDDRSPERWFGALAALRDALQRDSGVPLPELSMGMSGDLEAAVACGATFVRVGTALFGPRTPRAR